MKHAFLVFLIFAALPLAAQDRDMQLTAWVSRAQIDGDDDFTEDFATEYEDGYGLGLSINRFFGPMLSVEASAFYLRNDAALVLPGNLAIDLGTVNLRPISLGAQLHLPRRTRFDPYIGAGAAYVVAGQLSSRDLGSGGVGNVELENGITYYVNAGIGVQLGQALAIVADARYLPFETDSSPDANEDGPEQEIDLTAKFVSLGLRFKF